MKTLTQFITITIVLSIGVGAVIAAALRVDIAATWDQQRCNSYVVPIAGFFKPTDDPRTAAQFATDNWSFCKKEYIQNALRTAAAVPKAIADAEAGTVGIVQDIASTVADVFFKLKNMISTHKNSYDDNQLLSLFYDAALLLLLRTTEGLYNDLRRSYSEAVKALQVRDVTPCSIERFFSVSERRGKRESLSRCLHFFLSWRARERERDRDRERERQRERDGERESL